MKIPAVSIVTIFRDAEVFLEEAVDSVRGQTFQDWELVLVDDGSTDASTEIAKRLAREDSRLRYGEHDGHANRGMSASRNLGVRSSRADLVSFLDSDDVWLPTKLERQASLLEAHPGAEMVCGPTLWWYGWTGLEADRERDALRDLGVETDVLHRPPDLLERFLAGEARTPATCSVLVRRRAFNLAGGFREAFRGLYEDQVFFLEIYARFPVFVTAEAWDRYRQHPDSHCSVEDQNGPPHWDDANPARRRFLDWVETRFRDVRGE